MSSEIAETSLRRYVSSEVGFTGKAVESCSIENCYYMVYINRRKDNEVDYKVKVNPNLLNGTHPNLIFFQCTTCFKITDKENAHQFELWMPHDQTEATFHYDPHANT
ncbi:hypothetical protein D5018_00435 [Parashewanella curva]|uniref:Uncharacterized protein n=1 Tax=Parashewanella curva TaxID=2338552 RepID=A0A3L8Q299_9GAMM|nr:hypothetical protein [Parashewanella curva]RLV61620.1 hypothetical protein D5018_00435 [Parashewanella curva]